MLKLGTKCWISAFNAQSWRGVTVPVWVVAVKIYVAAVEALKKKERQSETQDSSKLMVFWVSSPPLNANVLFCRFFFLNLTLCMTKLRVPVLSFPNFMDISIVRFFCGFSFGSTQFSCLCSKREYWFNDVISLIDVSNSKSTRKFVLLMSKIFLNWSLSWKSFLTIYQISRQINQLGNHMNFFKY